MRRSPCAVVSVPSWKLRQVCPWYEGCGARTRNSEICANRLYKRGSYLVPHCELAIGAIDGRKGRLQFCTAPSRPWCGQSAQHE